MAAAVILGIAVLAIGLLFLRLHTLPERIAHKSHKLQFEIVAVLGLLALFTHIHLFWVIGLLLAMIDIPNFGGALGRIAGSLERMAGIPRGEAVDDTQGQTSAVVTRPEAQPLSRPSPKIVPNSTGS
ncbi:hypothetical protein LNAOJCKE_5657 [Methylorubrum aminovorans]|uniref:Uncharacterized protein n=2 Tax=Methylorubrum aminovorans TaxID=269069 RepID=A0ABQ4UN31_9HYPH|nr:hypothetical protein LNAOJCKE_5657 [Methylorubrum aminovorans]GMA74200.1 hypothetical protein GCM10025880_06170 [Methylorubrum aminovorans]